MLSAEKRSRVCNRIAALLMVAVVACQFLPYWSYGEGMKASVNAYVWFPTSHQGLTESLLSLVEKYPCNQAALVSIPVMLLSVLGAVFCLFKADKGWASVFALMAGGYGLIGYLSSPVMRAGHLWWVHVLLLVLIFAAGLAALLQKKHGHGADKK